MATNVQTEPRSEPQVQEQMAMMSKRLEALGDLVEELEVALVSVLRPPTEEESVVERDLVPLASELYNLNISIERANDRLINIIKRLEL